MSGFSFTSKAETLAYLAKTELAARILPLAHVRAKDWQSGRHKELQRLTSLSWMQSGTLIVRSSAYGEDCETASEAGRYLSLLKVAPEGVEKAIDQVFASFENTDERNGVLIQPMLENVTLSGVAFTADINTGSPYLVVSIARGEDTTAVTSGGKSALTTYYLWKNAETPAEFPAPQLVELALQLEAVTGHSLLDIEFAQDDKGQLYLFQVRPLSLRIAPADPASLQQALARIASRIEALNGPHPYLRGKKAVFGIMPDWNPAEIIGVRPRPLALSLYRELITDSIWAYQRSNYGYRNLRSFPLMLDFHGLPYIDVRVSFNSFVPADIPDDLADRIVTHYIDRLISAPALHDKVEFEIVFSCYTFDLPHRLTRLGDFGFSPQDMDVLSQSLRQLTNRIINRRDGLWRGDIERVSELENKRLEILSSDLPIIDRIYWLIEDCKRYGTLPFAGLARAGFIAVQMLNSLVAVGVLSSAEKQDFMSGLDTISAKMGHDLATQSRSEFLEAYGHLRPGTYDILSPRYDEVPDFYFDWDAVATRGKSGAQPNRHNFSLSLEQMRKVEALLKEHGLDHDVVGLFEFIEAGIRGREYAKFVFSHSLSDILSLLGKLGKELGMTLEDMSYFDIQTLCKHYASSTDLHEMLAETISQGRANHELTKRVVLPPLITDHRQVWGFTLPPNEPNFITQLTTRGRVCQVGNGEEIENSILFIPSADPGFDWIFSHDISGFVTAFGGINSHMAIRASELGIPAVIGAGEASFREWLKAECIEIDALNRRVTVLK
ncbi:MAG: phosphoenolpyruvate synthase [Alphaproteobacteria bacterium]|nr:phosphoenolpyruvate synthase [Alphaproteobacteria bacterium]